jgi:hypothetical protein
MFFFLILCVSCFKYLNSLPNILPKPINSPSGSSTPSLALSRIGLAGGNMIMEVARKSGRTHAPYGRFVESDIFDY